MKNNTCLNGLVPKRVIDQLPKELVPKRVIDQVPKWVGV